MQYQQKFVTGKEKKMKQKNQFMTNQHFRLQPSLNKEAHKKTYT